MGNRTKATDFIGKNFGELHIDAIYKKNNRSYCKCTCSCGNHIETTFSNLRTGNTQSCGASVHKNFYYKDLIGQNFGKLTVLEKTSERKSGKIIWLCKCQCGSLVKVRSDCLLNGHTTSCGCIISKGKEKIANILTKNNITFERQKIFDECKYSNGYSPRFDFFIENSYIIEYDGIQHFEEKDFFHQDIEKDLFKDKWCKEHNIPLIRIPYTKFDTLCLEDVYFKQYILNKEDNNAE